MKKILLLFFVSFFSLAFALDKKNLTVSNKAQDFYFFSDISEFKKELPAVIKNEKFDFPLNDDWEQYEWGKIFDETPRKAVFKYTDKNKDELYSYLFKKNIAAFFIYSEKKYDEFSKIKRLSIGLMELENDILYNRILSFDYRTRPHKEKIIITDNDIPKQNKTDRNRKDIQEDVSFLSFTADTIEDEIKDYLARQQIKYEYFIETKNGDPKFHLYYIYDLQYKNSTFKEIEVRYKLSDGFVHVYDNLDEIICTFLSEKDFDNFYTLIQKKFAYDGWDKVFYGKKRNYPNAQGYSAEYEYYEKNGDCKQQCFYDEIEFDKSGLSVKFAFSKLKKL